MRNIRIREVFIFIKIVRTWFACISVYFDYEFLKVMDIIFGAVT